MRASPHDAVKEEIPLDLYRKLIADTALFGISTFGARFLNFLLTPFYTRVLSSAEYGVTDLIIQSGDLIIPLASIGIADGVIRFGLERSTDKNAVFTTGLTITLGGSAVLLAVSPLLERLPFLTGHMWLVLLYVMMANVHSVCDQFARTMGHIRLFALDGILRTVAAITCSILFLAVFSMGVTGYVLSSILADALTTVLLFLCAKQWRHFRLSALSGRMAGQMLRYSAPLVPTSICAGVRELEEHGYVIRQRVRDPNGQLGAIEYTILEQPRPPGPGKPEREDSVLDDPEQAYPVLEGPEQGDPARSNTNRSSKEKSKIYQVRKVQTLSYPPPKPPGVRTGWDGTGCGRTPPMSATSRNTCWPPCITPRPPSAAATPPW